jgi:hypothetical protein
LVIQTIHRSTGGSRGEPNTVAAENAMCTNKRATPSTAVVRLASW